MKKYKMIIIAIGLLIIPFENVFAYDCSLVTGNGELTQWIDGIYTVIKFGALILTVALGMLDFFKAITGADEKALKKSGESFVKRLIAVAALFILPVLIQFLLDVVGLPYCLHF